MKVIRTRHSDGVTNDEISAVYHHAEVMQMDNSHWPRNGFQLKHGTWDDRKTEPNEGYERLIMWGAEIFITHNGDFQVKGFVNDETSWSRTIYPKKVYWVMETWHCYNDLNLDKMWVGNEIKILKR
jgi:hypothetical protein